MELEKRFIQREDGKRFSSDWLAHPHQKRFNSGDKQGLIDFVRIMGAEAFTYAWVRTEIQKWRSDWMFRGNQEAKELLEEIQQKYPFQDD